MRWCDPHLFDAFENPFTDGIFKALEDYDPLLPWIDVIPSEVLDTEYLGNWAVTITICYGVPKTDCSVYMPCAIIQM